MVMQTQILIWIGRSIVAISILFTAWQGRPWQSPLPFREKVSRVVSIGIGVAIALPILMTLLDLSKAPNYISISYSINFLLLFCFTMPFSLIAMVGSFISLSAFDEFRKRTLDKNR